MEVNRDSDSKFTDSALDFRNLIVKHGDEIPLAVKKELLRLVYLMDDELQTFSERIKEQRKEIEELQRNMDKLRRDLDYRSAE